MRIHRSSIARSLAFTLVLSLDLQRIRASGYNADRGPASFYALRLHWEG